jgi:tRNA pseudouridine synthase 10
MIDKVSKVLEKNLCDHCLGRMYSQLLTGYGNDERGRVIRNFVAMQIDAKSIDYSKMDPNNFYGFTFKENKEMPEIKKEKCWICADIFDKVDSMVAKAEKALSNIEFNNFLVGTRVPSAITEKENRLWEEVGIEFVESIKSELNREIGKRIGNDLNKPSEFKKPEVVVLADFVEKDAFLQINSLYVLGYYQKLVRGMPQCKWGTPGKYKTSVQEIIAKPFVKHARGSGDFFHGMGREDIDARCVGWRPFVIEVSEPVIRKINLTKIQREIAKTKKVRVKNLKFCDRFTVVRIKSEKGDKTYRVTVNFDKPVDKKDLRKLKGIIGTISQRTPQRVSHRRADLTRRRVVKELKYKVINSKKIELTVKTTAGLYVKELVSGDNDRTHPSVSEILGVKATPKDLDVIEVDAPKNL